MNIAFGALPGNFREALSTNRDSSESGFAKSKSEFIDLLKTTSPEVKKTTYIAKSVEPKKQSSVCGNQTSNADKIQFIKQNEKPNEVSSTELKDDPDATSANEAENASDAEGFQPELAILASNINLSEEVDEEDASNDVQSMDDENNEAAELNHAKTNSNEKASDDKPEFVLAAGIDTTSKSDDNKIQAKDDANNENDIALASHQNNAEVDIAPDMEIAKPQEKIINQKPQAIDTEATQQKQTDVIKSAIELDNNEIITQNVTISDSAINAETNKIDLETQAHRTELVTAQDENSQEVIHQAINVEAPKLQHKATINSDAELSKDITSIKVSEAENAVAEAELSGEANNGQNENELKQDLQAGKNSRNAEKIESGQIFSSNPIVTKADSLQSGLNFQSASVSKDQVINQISQNISNQASVNRNNDVFTIKLSPETLGEVEVQVIATQEGKIDSIKLTVKEPETYRLISESQKELLDSLKQVCDVDDSSLSFNLKEGSQEGQDAQHQQSMHELFQQEAEYNSENINTQKILAQNSPNIYNNGQIPSHEGVSITL